MKIQTFASAALAIWAITSVQSVAQPTGSEVMSPIDGGFVEVFQGDTRLSSANGVFGVEFDKVDAVFDARAVYVHVPNGFDGLLCVQLSSIDGDYWAEIQYDLSGLGSGIKRLDFETSYAEELTHYRAEDIAILATVRPACNTPRPEAVFVTSLEAKPPEEIIFYLSGGDYKVSVEIPHLEGGEVSLSCEKLKDSSVFRIYNVKCVLPINSLLDYSQAKVHRTRIGTQRLRPIHLPLNLP